jgi:hypothetical protein
MPANFDGSTQQRRALVSYQHSTNHQLLPRASLTVFHSSVIPRFITRLRSVVKIVDLRWHLSDHGELFSLLYLLADNKTRLIQSPEVKLSLVSVEVKLSLVSFVVIQGPEVKLRQWIRRSPPQGEIAFLFSLLTSLPVCEAIRERHLNVTFGLWMRPSMLTRKPTVGGGADSSGACGPPSAWRVLRPLPCPRRFSARATRGPALGAHVFKS